MTLDLYADGGVIGPNPSAMGGTWAFILVCRETQKAQVGESGVILPTNIGVDQVTNNHSEYFALLKGLESLPDGWSGHVYSDSNVSLGRLFKGWATNNLPDAIVERGKAAISRLGDIEWTLLDGHPTKKQLKEGTGKRGNPVSKWNVLCDKECNRLAKRFVNGEKE